MHIKAIFRFLISAVFGLAGGAIALVRYENLPLGFVLLWDIFALCLAALSFREFATISKDRIKKLCAQEDDSTWLLFAIVLTACMASLIILLFLIDNTAGWNIGATGKILCVLAVVLSWILLHTIFTFRYAHMYYGDENERYAKSMRGLEFPGKELPDYFDFAYFSFVIGMTFQVSDVTITSKKIRRLTLLHSLIAFVFNTVIVALTVSQMINGL
jgi:uncharacterized membrane protein